MVGAGGTGTYFLKEFSRFLSGEEGLLKTVSSMWIADGDLVEAKNLKRQAFSEEDVGQKKSAVMAEVLNEAFGLSWKASGAYLTKPEQLAKMTSDSSIWDPRAVTVPLVIGCVDNHAARMVCERFFKSCANCIYFDAANEFSSGEVVFASRLGGRTLSPTRSDVFPEVKKKRHKPVTEMSCTELNAVSPQHIAANMNAGLCLLSAAAALLKEGRIASGVTFFDAATMTSTHEECEGLSGKAS